MEFRSFRADIPDLREMVTDEDMAVSFFAKGDSGHLAKELTTILQSPELQRSMAEQNFAAGVKMTMGSVVRSYLRWFELKKCQSDLARGASVLVERTTSVASPRVRKNSLANSFACEGMAHRYRTEHYGKSRSFAGFRQPVDLAQSRNISRLAGARIDSRPVPGSKANSRSRLES